MVGAYLFLFNNTTLIIKEVNMHYKSKLYKAISATTAASIFLSFVFFSPNAPLSTVQANSLTAANISSVTSGGATFTATITPSAGATVLNPRFRVDGPGFTQTIGASVTSTSPAGLAVSFDELIVDYYVDAGGGGYYPDDGYGYNGGYDGGSNGGYNGSYVTNCDCYDTDICVCHPDYCECLDCVVNNGENGENGTNGYGLNGENGTNGYGLNGENGTNGYGLNGENGINGYGLNGANGINGYGLNGANGINGYGLHGASVPAWMNQSAYSDSMPEAVQPAYTPEPISAAPPAWMNPQPAPVMPEAAPAPVVPVIPAPIVPEAAPAPVMPEAAPAPVVPVIPAPVVPEAAPAPVMPEAAPAPVVPVPMPTAAPVIPAPSVPAPFPTPTPTPTPGQQSEGPCPVTGEEICLCEVFEQGSPDIRGRGLSHALYVGFDPLVTGAGAISYIGSISGLHSSTTFSVHLILNINGVDQLFFVGSFTTLGATGGGFPNWNVHPWIHVEPVALHMHNTTVRVHAWGWPNIPSGWHGGHWPHWTAGTHGPINWVGVEVARNPNFSGARSFTQNHHSGTINFSTQSGQVYYIRAFVQSTGSTRMFGPTQSFRANVNWIGNWNQWNQWGQGWGPGHPGHWGWWGYGTWAGANRDRNFITTNQPTEVTSSSATLSAHIPNRVWGSGWNDWNNRILERGFVWSSTNRMPTLSNNVVREQSNNFGTYTMTLSNLSANNTYYVSAFFRTPTRVYYGNVVTLTTTSQVTTPGAQATINVQFRTLAGQERGTAQITSTIGSTVNPSNFTIPAGYTVWPPNWTYVVTGDASILIMLTQAGTVPPGTQVGGTNLAAGEFFPGRAGFTFAPDAAVSRGELAQAIFNLQASSGVPPGPGVQFSDTANSPFNQAISFVSARGFMNGYPDGTFRPGGQLSRAEAAAVLSRIYGLTGFGSAQFIDTQGHWASNYIGLAADRGIINGYPNGTFGPNNPLSRAEAVALLARADGRGMQPLQQQRFVDVPDWHWAFNYIMSAAVPRQ